ncbi:MAG: dethiobiotin synthase [Thermoguttaceae bacterium]|nr:dethiobiotin synthase [Thermoguttaceae bacterium]
MNNGIFIVGTGTDVGKTYIAGLLTRFLRQKGINAGYYKAALSGAIKENGRLIPGDAAFVCNMAQLDLDPQRLVSYVYETAVSPAFAAELEGNPPDLEKIVLDCTQVGRHYDFLVVEGSGGIYCPVRRGEVNIELTDIIHRLGFDTILVADAGLGTLNNIVLTLEYAKNRNIAVRGIILNRYDGDNFLHRDNKQTLEQDDFPPVLALVSQGGDLENICLALVLTN